MIRHICLLLDTTHRILPYQHRPRNNCHRHLSRILWMVIQFKSTCSIYLSSRQKWNCRWNTETMLNSLNQQTIMIKTRHRYLDARGVQEPSSHGHCSLLSHLPSSQMILRILIQTTTCLRLPRPDPRTNTRNGYSEWQEPRHEYPCGATSHRNAACDQQEPPRELQLRRGTYG